MDRQRILELLAESIEKDPVELASLAEGTDLTELGLGSLVFVQFVVALEEAFEIEVLDSDLLIDNFKTPETMFKTLEKYFMSENVPKKVLICDCDNVLWKGIAGEETLSLPAHVLELHTYLLELYRAGILLCLCSRNEPDNIVQAFVDLSTQLKPEHFLVKKIGWNNKADSIREMSEELNLSSDSFVFLDDSDYELGAIRTLLPEVTCIKVDTDTFPMELRDFFPSASGVVSFDRNVAYREQKEREKEKLHYATIEDYNRSLNTQFDCCIAQQEDIARIAELSQRTNQCNLSATHYTEEEVSALLHQDNHTILCLQASDRFGDMGIVGAAVVEIRDDSAVIESFWLSCRVFDRGFEEAMLEYIQTMLHAKTLYGVYRKVDKNKRFADFYERNGVNLYEN